MRVEMIEAFSLATAHLYQDALASQARLRYRVFVRQRGLCHSFYNDLEYDEFAFGDLPRLARPERDRSRPRQTFADGSTLHAEDLLARACRHARPSELIAYL